MPLATTFLLLLPLVVVCVLQVTASGVHVLDASAGYCLHSQWSPPGMAGEMQREIMSAGTHVGTMPLCF